MKKIILLPLAVLLTILALTTSCSRRITQEELSASLAPDNNSTPLGITDGGKASASTEKPVIELTEIDAGGNKIPLVSGYRVIDPNSEITITINKSSLLNETSEDKELTQRLKALKAMIEAEEEAIKKLNNAIIAFNKASPSEKGAVWQRQLNDLGPIAGLILDDPEGDAIYTSLNPSSDFETQYRDLFRTAAILVERLEEKIIKYAEENGQYVQLGAWIQRKGGSRAVHIPGFDDYEAQPTYRVEQYQINLTEEQKRDVQAIASLANQANSEGIKATLNAQSSIKSVIASVLELESVKRAKQLETDVRKLIQDGQVPAGQAKEDLERAANLLSTYLSVLESKSAAYQSQEVESNPGSLLLKINSDLEHVQNITVELDTELKNVAQSLQQQWGSLAGIVQAAIQPSRNALTSIAGAIESDIKNLKPKINQALQIIVAGENFKLQALEFTDLVKKLSFDQVPQKATLDLETTGERDLGDKLIIKMATGSKAGGRREIYSQSFNLYFCTPFVRTAVGFLFTDPVPLFESAHEKALFYYAPSYSILLKGFWKNPLASRKNLNYHRLFSPGLGLNISTLDFNNDGEMEVGIGGVFSIFNDFLQMGYGANMYDGRGFYFFGLKIPVGSFSIR